MIDVAVSAIVVTVLFLIHALCDSERRIAKIEATVATLAELHEVRRRQ